ncbi:MAG: hypothetical protein ACR2PM_09850 [Hyphomicrobiales bacterium]
MDLIPGGLQRFWQGLSPVQRLAGFAALAAAVALIAFSFGGGAKIEVASVKLPNATGPGWSDSQTLTAYAAAECDGKSSCSVNLWVRDPIKADEVQVGYVCVSGDHRMPLTMLTVPVKQELAETVLFCQ